MSLDFVAAWQSQPIDHQQRFEFDGNVEALGDQHDGGAPAMMPREAVQQQLEPGERDAIAFEGELRMAHDQQAAVERLVEHAFERGCEVVDARAFVAHRLLVVEAGPAIGPVPFERPQRALFAQIGEKIVEPAFLSGLDVKTRGARPNLVVEFREQCLSCLHRPASPIKCRRATAWNRPCGSRLP
ncbi:hypothetical protein [Paraburkholderia sp. BR14262]|uniref:hypothetical protein n=1 Tax=Paraburkholderia sp. BR14262 TaxID=3236999 RepID=UPI0034CF94B2